MAILVWSSIMLFSQHPSRWRHWFQSPKKLGYWQAGPLIPAFIWISLSTALFGYFRYIVPSPWHGHPSGEYFDGQGQSWSQYKITIWSSFCIIGVAGALCTWWAMQTRSKLCKYTPAVILAVWCATGLGWNYAFARRRGAEFMVSTGTQSDPLTICKAMRQKLMLIPENDWIYLDWPCDIQANKFRRVMILLLADHRLASKWPGEDIIAQYTTPTDAKRGSADCAWILKYETPTNYLPGNAASIGGMTLTKNILQHPTSSLQHY